MAGPGSLGLKIEMKMLARSVLQNFQYPITRKVSDGLNRSDPRMEDAGGGGAGSTGLRGRTHQSEVDTGGGGGCFFFSQEGLGVRLLSHSSLQQVLALVLCTQTSGFWFWSLGSLVQGPKGRHSEPPAILPNLGCEDVRTHQESDSLPGNQAVNTFQLWIVAQVETTVFLLCPSGNFSPLMGT